MKFKGPLSNEDYVTWMFEVYYSPPSDSTRETRIRDLVEQHGGWLDFREAPELDGSHNICLTFEFNDINRAEAAISALSQAGEYVEGPQQYS